jgi:hypothetical protein
MLDGDGFIYESIQSVQEKRVNAVDKEFERKILARPSKISFFVRNSRFLGPVFCCSPGFEATSLPLYLHNRYILTFSFMIVLLSCRTILWLL